MLHKKLWPLYFVAVFIIVMSFALSQFHRPATAGFTPTPTATEPPPTPTPTATEPPPPPTLTPTPPPPPPPPPSEDAPPPEPLPTPTTVVPLLPETGDGGDVVGSSVGGLLLGMVLAALGGGYLYQRRLMNKIG